MQQRVGWALLWLGFVVYAFFLAPADDLAATGELIRRLVQGDIAGINPWIVAEFNLMGVLPLAYTSLLLVDGHRQKALGQKVPAWPFALLMMGVGAFALLPYLMLRRPLQGQEGIPPLNSYLRVWTSRWVGWGLLVTSLGLLGFAGWRGDWADFWQQWQTSRFIHVMTLDFCLLTSVLPFLVNEDRVGRAALPPLGIGMINSLPLLGALGYLCLRPAPLPEVLQPPD
ncbi:MAG: DUF2834 domain-containing protein [Cyanobacteriota bacterium]|nr:DUF2834 domain-containing protein [Cyanobacteriota bacterium]